MGWRDDLRAAARLGAGLLGEALLKAAESESGSTQDEDQDRAPGGDAQDNAKNAPVPDEAATEDPKAMFWDPFAIVEQLGYKEKHSQVAYGTLKAMVWKTPVIQAIVQTRINQVASFAQLQPDRYNLGYQIRLRDSEKQPTRAAKDWAKQMAILIQRTGVTDNPRGRDGFEKFLRKLTWDSLVYDQMCFEVVPNKQGQPAEWYAVDGSTIRLADSQKLFYDEDDTEAVRYVQIYDGQIIAEYTQEEMCFSIRNPRTDIRNYGYGTSELEMLVNTVTSMLWSWEYNQKFFSHGSSQKGILNFKGAIPEKQLKAFRRHWYQMIAGVENAWRTPIVNADELQWVNLQSNNKDMEFSAWMDFLIKVACSMYQMDPLEVNFKYGNAGQKSGLQEASNKEKITESKERGLRPLLRNIEQAINHYIIWPLNEDFQFQFVGLDAQTRDDVAKLNTQRAKTTWMIDELRAEEDLPPLPDELGKVILDPTWLQYKQMVDGADQEGGPGDGGFGNGDEEDEVDFEALLAEEEDTGDEGNAEAGAGGDKDQGNGPAKPEKPEQPGKFGKGEETQKSMSSRNVVIDVRL